MIFNSFVFFIFLFFVLIIYYCLKRKAQNIFLLFASYFFYGWWDWRFLGLLFLSTVVDYNVARLIGRAESISRKKQLLLVSLIVNFSILGFFKYYGFFIENFTIITDSVGLSLDPFTLKVILPLGISFYTLQTVGYTIDVYRGKIKPCDSLTDFALFVSFFPQLVAGPIERASHLIPQLQRERVVNYEMIKKGCFLILFGLFQKMIIADNLAVVVDRVFEAPAHFTSYELLIGLYAFAFQIYCDFAGYSNIAIGTALLLGVDIMENFNCPYFSVRIGDFWHRWHISLSTWLRDYLYFTMGGSRSGNVYINLMVTMTIVGLWHGASWMMLIWGAIHGLYLVIDRRFPKKDSAAGNGPGLIGRMAGMILTFHLVCLSWVFFRAPTLGNATSYLTNLATHWGVFRVDFFSRMALPFIAMMLIFDLFHQLADSVHFYNRWGVLGRAALYSFLFITILFLSGANIEPFIYFLF